MIDSWLDRSVSVSEELESCQLELITANETILQMKIAAERDAAEIASLKSQIKYRDQSAEVLLCNIYYKHTVHILFSILLMLSHSP